MKYVLQDNKRLYFKRGWSEDKIKKYYNGLLMEQDFLSPHRYEHEDFHVYNGDVVIDAGVAEGNFALSVIEKVEKIYLFEPDKEWIDVLERTFMPWKEKIVIVNKYIDDTNDDSHVTLDNFSFKEKINFLKIDIEGEEVQLLNGSNALLTRQNNLRIAICTYHHQNDAEEINKILIADGFCTNFSKGFMIYKYDNALEFPYIRRGLIRGSK